MFRYPSINTNLLSFVFSLTVYTEQSPSGPRIENTIQLSLFSIMAFSYYENQEQVERILGKIDEALDSFPILIITPTQFRVWRWNSLRKKPPTSFTGTR